MKPKIEEKYQYPRAEIQKDLQALVLLIASNLDTMRATESWRTHFPEADSFEKYLDEVWHSERWPSAYWLRLSRTLGDHCRKMLSEVFEHRAFDGQTLKDSELKLLRNQE